ncbi:MAG: glycoside hydrolase family 127 protein [Phycisphaeraceae bacterium]|nr:glycoside hydrolase family 127 protein [Phycisphaeraceae bacterium]
MSASQRLAAGPVDTSKSAHAQLRTLPLSAAKLGDGLWRRYQQMNREVSLGTGYAQLEEAGNFHDLKLAARQIEGKYRGKVFIDSDLYKWLEAVAWETGREDSADLDRMLHGTGELLAAAQEPNGYLNSYYQVLKTVEERWSNLRADHELYCAGHLMQAAVAEARTTGPGNVLKVACKLADLIDQVFGPGKREGACGHPEIEMALVELYRQTGENRYLELAQVMVDRRGKGFLRPPGQEGRYLQDRLAVRDCDEVEGHAVRQLYLLCGAVDLYMEKGDQALWAASERLWKDFADRKMYITGGSGVHHRAESFGDAYELPNHNAYCETCATIAAVMLGWRMLLASGQANYADVMERALYNGFLSGVGLDGKSWFYSNRLASEGHDQRSPWFGCACCPPNVMRMLATIEHYMATTNDQGVQIHLYNPAELDVRGPWGEMKLAMQTRYPWDGSVRLGVKEATGGPIELSLRIPDWCEGAKLRVNGNDVPGDGGALSDGGHRRIKRVWKGGDEVELDLPMRPMLVESDPRVEATRGCVAVQRGPLVYCFEQCDQNSSGATNIDVRTAAIDVDQPLTEKWEGGLLGGVVTIRARGVAEDLGNWSGRLYRQVRGKHGPQGKAVELVAVPYHLWANRQLGPMRVWLPRTS